MLVTVITCTCRLPDNPLHGTEYYHAHLCILAYSIINNKIVVFVESVTSIALLLIIACCTYLMNTN